MALIPFSDMRSFVPNSGRLLSPGWPNPDPRHFVRGLGSIHPRTFRDDSWAGESYFCNAERAIRFADGMKDFAEAAACEYPTSEFRRYFSDGIISSRLEIGLSDRKNKKNNQHKTF